MKVMRNGRVVGHVVHVKKDSCDVYVGRGKNSIFGNPFVVGAHAKRDECIELFRRWLWQEIAKNSEYREEVRKLHGKTLGCWCSPRACHAEVLLRCADWLVNG